MNGIGSGEMPFHNSKQGPKDLNLAGTKRSQHVLNAAGLSYRRSLDISGGYEERHFWILVLLLLTAQSLHARYSGRHWRGYKRG